MINNKRKIINEAKSVDEGVVLGLLIVGLVKIASGAFDLVAATANEHVVKLVTAHGIFNGSASSCSFWYRPLSNHGAVLRSRIGLTLAFLELIRVFFEFAATLRSRDSCVCKTFVWNWTKVWGIQRSSSVSKILKLLKICSSVSNIASVQHKDGNLLRCDGTGWNNVPNTASDESFTVTCDWPVWKCKHISKIRQNILGNSTLWSF